VKDQSDRDARKLHSSLHYIAIRYELQQTEIDGLREALRASKRCKKKSKRLDLQKDEEYDGGADFWSPGKFQDARAREVVKQEENQLLAAQKAEMKKLRRSNKLCKEEMAKARRVAREAAKVAREREKAEKAESHSERGRAGPKTTAKRRFNRSKSSTIVPKRQENSFKTSYKSTGKAEE
jgi:conjugal transfer/entry exclusion protein